MCGRQHQALTAVWFTLDVVSRYIAADSPTRLHARMGNSPNILRLELYKIPFQPQEDEP